MFIHDRLYGRVEFSGEAVRLLQTPEFSRLRQVSLSAVPVWAIPAGTCASKAEHSAGAAHLAGVLCAARPELRDHERDLFCACLIHDIATPPFSHLTEHFMKLLLGKSHEEFAADVVDGSELGREITRYGASLGRVLDYVRGLGGPVGRLVCGEIDLDNLDNTLRYGLSLGILPGHRHLYSPELLARGFVVGGGSVALEEGALGELAGWARCREVTYRFTYGPENLAPCAMIFRALDLAAREGEIKRPFFRLRDDEAYDHLERACNPRTRLLAERARHFRPYELGYAFASAEAPAPLAAFLRDPRTRMSLADEIALATGRPPEDVAVYAGLNRAFKKLSLAVVTPDGAPADGAALPEMSPTWLLHVYVREAKDGDRDAAAGLLESRLPRGEGFRVPPAAAAAPAPAATARR